MQFVKSYIISCIFLKNESNGTGSFEIKLRSTVREGAGRTSYIEGFSRIIDYMDVSEDDIENLFKRIKNVSRKM